ncbi:MULTISPECIES: hypothetical protein [Reichenbachiella]|uniref:Uncharacterized protein n=1 Tax=Reichenbachiella agariperforans TaxID=156994 RepID=A0A1M6JUP8_REIAG|nr:MULTISPECIES: hypothetical protein [Reichenbachiella]MBU2913309.1 hypothetical protein [Reichenbachiella agariperforans]RJE74705.1 hypothetical protein BGP76_16355 [Reichenbachiella sp. MSK19-1]SHJ50418.1 hypothetical protein SAMN04488028_101327 [Reichenbachiella agariperforans]
MRNKLIFSTLLIFLLVNTSFGQGFVFRVLASKGANQVKKASGETTPLKTGATLMSGDELIAANGAYIGLMHKTGRTIEVRNSGVTKITDLESKLAKSQSDVANKYAQFVMNKMNEDDGDVNSNYRQNMKATGAVTRAASDGSLKVMLPSSVDILNPNAIIRWTQAPDVENPQYVVSIKNIFDEEIYKAETEDTSLAINFDDENLSSERLVILSVKVKDQMDLVSGDYGIKRISADDASAINENLEALKSAVPDDSPLNKLIFASFYEENNLILDALTQYEEAIELSPEVDDFKMIYDDFLIKNGLQ